MYHTAFKVLSVPWIDLASRSKLHMLHLEGGSLSDIPMLHKGSQDPLKASLRLGHVQLIWVL